MSRWQAQRALTRAQSGAARTTPQQTGALGAAEEDSYPLLFAKHPQPMWVYDEQTLAFLEVNEAAVAAYGYARHEFLAMRILDIRPEEDRPRLLEDLARLRPDADYTGPWRHRRKDGTIIAVEVTSQRVPFGGRPGILVVVRDITKQEHTERALRELERRFAVAFQASPVALVISRLDGSRIVEVNDAYAQLLGYAREELLGRSAAEVAAVVHPEQRAEIVQRLQVEGVIHAYDLMLRTRSGAIREALCSFGRIESGGEAYLLGILFDITERKQLQRELRRREQQLAFLADASAVLASSLDYATTLTSVAQLAVPAMGQWCAVHIVDGDGAVLELAVAHADPAMVQVARRLQERYPPDPAQDQGVYRVVRTGQPELLPTIPEELLVAAAQDDEHLVLIRSLELHSAVVVPLRARDRILGAITLVSREPGRYSQADLPLLEDLAYRAAMAIDNAHLYRAEREAEEAIRQINAGLERRVAARTKELQAANKELEAFAYSVSHDLRAPLRSLDGFSRILMERYGHALDEAGKRYLAHVRGAAQDMGQLIDALLRLARTARAELHREQVDLTALAHAVVAELVRADPERTIAVTIADGLLAEGDRPLLRVVLENLLGNAWKFTRRRANAHIELGSTDGSDSAVYFVRDNGAGFDMQYATNLFGAFQRLHGAAEFEGLGIGLATVQRVIHRHGGQIWAEGKEDEGATFYFTLDSSLEAHHGY